MILSPKPVHSNPMPKAKIGYPSARPDSSSATNSAVRFVATHTACTGARATAWRHAASSAASSDDGDPGTRTRCTAVGGIRKIDASSTARASASAAFSSARAAFVSDAAVAV